MTTEKEALPLPRQTAHAHAHFGKYQPVSNPSISFKRNCETMSTKENSTMLLLSQRKLAGGETSTEFGLLLVLYGTSK